MKRTNEATDGSDPSNVHTKRTKAEEDEPTSVPNETVPVAESAQVPDFPAPLPVDIPAPVNGDPITLDNHHQLPPPPTLTQHPPSLAELTLARATRNNALEAAQHQLATAVLRQHQVEDAFKFQQQQQAAVAEYVRQQQQMGVPGVLGNAAVGSPALNSFGNLNPLETNPYLNMTAAGQFPVGAAGLMSPMKTDAMLPNYSLLSVAPNAMTNLASTNFMSLTKEEQQGHLLMLAKSTQTGVSTSKKHGPYIPGIATRGEAFYDPGPVRDLSLPSDRGNLSEYQCLLRKQIVLFAVTMNDIQCSAQGRNKPIVLGQVGVLCRHCAKMPPGMRPCGSAYFPAKLSGLYQASQNMAINHFTKSCRRIGEDVREKLINLKAQKSTVLGGGKHFWANGAKVLGVVEIEQEGLLRFKGDDQIVSQTGPPAKEEEEKQQEEVVVEENTAVKEEATT